MRLPVVARELTAFEKEYQKLSEQRETEKSYLNDWELTKKNQSKLMQDVKVGCVFSRRIHSRIHLKFDFCLFWE